MSEHKVELDVRLNLDKVGKDFDDLEKQAKSGAEKVGDAMDDMQESVDDAADKTKSSTKETESAYDRLIKKIREQQEEVRQLKQQYQSAVLEFGEASSEARNLAVKIGEASAELAQNQAQLQNAAEAADRYDQSLEDVSDSLEEGTDRASIFGDVLKGSLASAAIEKGIGAVASGIQTIVSDAFEMQDANRQLQASTGATAAEMEAYGDVMNDIYAAGYGESVMEVADGMALVRQYTGELDSAKLRELTENTMALSDTFGGDFSENIRGVDALMKNMGLTADEAFDYIVVGAQNGLNKSNELTDNLAEYSSLWSQAGFSAEEMFTILQNGLDSGAYNLDKVNDFVKEFSISLSDGRIEENIDSFSESTQGLFYQWKNGEATTKDVFYSIINDLSSMENQQQALTIASNTWSALGEDNAMMVLTALDDVNDTYKDVQGSMEDIKGIRYDSLANQYKTLGRTFQTQVATPIVQKFLPVAQAGTELLADNIDAIVPIAGAAGAAMATIWVTKKAQSLIGSLKDAASAISGLVFQTTAQAAATGTATVAQEGLNVAMNANPIGLVVSGVAGLVAGLAMFSSLVGKSDAEKLAEEMEEAREAAEETRDEYQELSKGYRNNSDEIMGLWRQVQTLYQTEGKSAEQKKQLSELVDELNKKVPELGLSYDALNDSLNQTVESIDEVIRAEAGQAAYDSAIEARTEAAKEYNEASAEQKEITEQLADAEKRLADEIADNPEYYEMYGETINGTASEVRELKAALEDADGTVNATSETLEQASLDAEYYGLMVADVDANTRNLINTILTQIDSLGRQDEAYGQSVEALSMLTDAHTSNQEQIQASIDSINGKISELEQSYNDAKDAAYDSITEQLGLFNNMTTEATLSIDDMLGALDSQISYLDTFSQNMETAVAWGVDEGLLAQLSDGSEESAAILQSIVDAGQDAVTGPGGLNEKFAQVEEGKERFSSTVAEMETDFSASMKELQADLDEATAAMNKEDDAYRSGVQTIQGYINGSESMRKQLIGTYDSLGDACSAAFNAATEIESPSKVFRRSGRYTIQGAVLGAEDERPKLLSTYTNLGESVADVFGSALMHTGNYAGIFDAVSEKGRMSSWIDAMYQAVSQNGSRSGALARIEAVPFESRRGNDGPRQWNIDYNKIAAANAKAMEGMTIEVDERQFGRVVRKVAPA